MTARVAIVTGAARGLGRAFADHLANRGYAVVLSDLDESVSQAATAITGRGGQAVAVPADVTEESTGTRLVEVALANFGRLDACVTAAAVCKPQVFHRTAASTLRAALETNVVGTALVASVAAATMRAAGHGRVVMVGSSAGFHGEPGISAYAASKAAVIALARSAAAEGAKHDVLCNVLLPFAWTEMSSNGIDPTQADHLRPELVAPVVGALADRECHLNGQVIISAGGLLRSGSAVEGDSVAVPCDGPLAPHELARLLQISRQAPTRTYKTGQQAFLDLLSDLPAVLDKDRL